MDSLSPSAPVPLVISRSYNTLVAPQRPFGNVQDVARLIDATYHRLTDSASQRLVFQNVTLEQLHALDDIRSTGTLGPMRITYFESEHILVIKLVCILQATLAEHVNAILVMSFKELGITRRMLRLLGSSLQNLSSHATPALLLKEPDKSYLPNTRSGDELPSWVIEVGVSEPLAQLRLDAKLWLECTDGRTRLVLLVKLDVSKRRIIMEVWRGVRRPATRAHPESWIAQKLQDQHDIIVQFSDPDNIQVRNAPLTLPVAPMFDDSVSLPAGILGDRISISESDLCDLAREMHGMMI